jgi:hypothetical protein
VCTNFAGLADIFENQVLSLYHGVASLTNKLPPQLSIQIPLLVIMNVVVADASKSTSTTDAHAPNSSDQGAARVFTEIELAKATTERLGKGYDGTVIENIATVSSSDLCGSILGYVDKIVQLGDILSQVVTPHTFHVNGFTYRLIRFIHTPSWRGKH